MGKSLGFSKEEFSVICNVYDITQLVCFKAHENVNLQENAKNDTYNQILFQLYKKGYIMVGETEFVVSEEVKAIFSILKKSETVITISAKDESVPGYCIYFSDEEKFVLMRDGTRKGEYVKCELMNKEEFFSFLKDSEALLADTLWEDFSEKRRERDVIGEQLIEFLEKGNLESAENLWEIPQVNSLFRIQNPRSGNKKCYIAVVKQPIQDKIVIVNEENIRIFSYTEKKMMELFQEIQENENGIGRCNCSKCE